MTTNRLHNYITINRGSKDGIVRGQGVRNEEGVVGIIKTVGQNYSVVLPVINTNSNISCRFAKNDYAGILRWDGKDNRFALLTDVAAHMVVNPGDTIVTSGLSPVFPEGIAVGIVESSVLKDGDSYYTIRVRLSTNFKRLKYVEVVQNKDQQELEELTDGMD
jgi:rod shape-determining protein MreC